MSMKFTLGNASTVTSGGRANTVRADEGAVVTAERLTLEYSTWTLEGWARIEAWPKSSTTYVTMALGCANNGELLIQNNAGALSAVAKFYVSDSAGAKVTYTLSGFAITPSSTWRHFCLAFSLANTRGCVWMDGVVKDASAAMTSTGSAVYVQRKYVGLFANVSGSDIAVDTGATPGVVSLDNWRFSSGERRTYNTGFTPPAAEYSDTGYPTDSTRFIWRMRETSTPLIVRSNFGKEHGILRVSAHGDRYAGPWAITPNSTPNPV